MKILFVAFPFSIHTARWIRQLEHTGWEIHLFPSMDFHPLHSSITGITYYQPSGYEFSKIPGNKYIADIVSRIPFKRKNFVRKLSSGFSRSIGMNKSSAAKLSAVIKKIKPDIIHSLETQHAGYLVKESRDLIKGDFPVWIHSNWGIDLHFFGRLKSHQVRIKETLNAIDILIVEGKRDEVLAADFGFKGTIQTFSSVGGGFVKPPIDITPPSLRRKILIKGSEDIVRRGLVALRAVERCADMLSGYEIILYSANEITAAAAELSALRSGLQITVSISVSHEEMLRLNSQAKLSICVNVSDGLPNAMLEAMMMGAFPIQSETSLAGEWIEHGRNGMLVPPEDPDIIEKAIRESLGNDEMVDTAVSVNRKLIMDRLDYNQVRERVIEMYKAAVM